MVDKTGLAFVVCVLSGLVGCAGITEPKVQSVPLNADSLFSSTGALNTSTVQRAGSDFVVCMGPGADVAFDHSDSSNISISLISRGSDTDGLTNTASEVELTGRTPSLLMARELLYRTCEFSKNFQLSKKEATQLFIETLKGVVGVWRIESGNTKVRIGDRLISNVEQSLESKVRDSQSLESKIRDSQSQESDFTQSMPSNYGSSEVQPMESDATQNALSGVNSDNSSLQQSSSAPFVFGDDDANGSASSDGDPGIVPGNQVQDPDCSQELGCTSSEATAAPVEKNPVIDALLE